MTICHQTRVFTEISRDLFSCHSIIPCRECG